MDLRIEGSKHFLQGLNQTDVKTVTDQFLVRSKTTLRLRVRAAILLEEEAFMEGNSRNDASECRITYDEKITTSKL